MADSIAEDPLSIRDVVSSYGYEPADDPTHIAIQLLDIADTYDRQELIDQVEATEGNTLNVGIIGAAIMATKGLVKGIKKGAQKRKARRAGIMAEGEGANEAALLEIRQREIEAAQIRQTQAEVKKKEEDKKKRNQRIGAVLIIIVIIGLLSWGGGKS